MRHARRRSPHRISTSAAALVAASTDAWATFVVIPTAPAADAPTRPTSAASPSTAPARPTRTAVSRRGDVEFAIPAGWSTAAEDQRYDITARSPVTGTFLAVHERLRAHLRELIDRIAVYTSGSPAAADPKEFDMSRVNPKLVPQQYRAFLAHAERLRRTEAGRFVQVRFKSGADVGLAPLDSWAFGVTLVKGFSGRWRFNFPSHQKRWERFNALEITRGCVFSCRFCQTPFMFSARFRHRSVENVRWHVDRMRERGLRDVRFITPTALSYGSQTEEPDLAAVEELLAGCREGIGPNGRVFFGSFPSEIRPEPHEQRRDEIREHDPERRLARGGASKTGVDRRPEPVPLGVRACRLDRDRIDVHAEDARRAEAHRGDRQDPGAAADIEDALPRDRAPVGESLEGLEAEPGELALVEAGHDDRSEPPHPACGRPLPGGRGDGLRLRRVGKPSRRPRTIVLAPAGRGMG